MLKKTLRHIEPEWVGLDAEQKFKLSQKIKNPDMVASNRAIIGLKRISPRTLCKQDHAYTEYCVIREDKGEYIFTDADLQNLNPYDLAYVFGILDRIMEKKEFSCFLQKKSSRGHESSCHAFKSKGLSHGSLPWSEQLQNQYSSDQTFLDQ